MGSGSSKKATPSIAKGFSREKTFRPVEVSNPTTQTGSSSPADDNKTGTGNNTETRDSLTNNTPPVFEDGTRLSESANMGSGSSKKATPSIAKGFSREKTFRPVEVSNPTTQTGSSSPADDNKTGTGNNTETRDSLTNNTPPVFEDGTRLSESANMGSGSSKKATPSIAKGFSREKTFRPVEVSNPTTQTGSSSPADDNKTGTGNNTETRDSLTNNTPPVFEDDSTFIKTIYGTCNSKWPIRCFGKLEFNVNARHGGCAGLYLGSCQFGGNGEETNAELMLLRSGFDCNHVSTVSIATDHQGSFGASNHYYLAEDGQFVADCLFGHNHLMLLTNDSRYTNLRNGVYGETDKNSSYELPINLNQSALALVLCSGLDGKTPINSLYMIRVGFKDDKFQPKCICGEDKFTFEAEDGKLFAKGVKESKFGLFYNQDALKDNPGSHVFVCHSGSLNGTDAETLMTNLTGHSTLLVLCSNSNGSEDSTAASVYVLSINEGKIVASNHLSGSHADSYETSDLWTFEVSSRNLTVKGPKGPCRYAVMSNIKSSIDELSGTIKQRICLASGEQSKVTGNVKVTKDKITGSVSKSKNICIMFDHKVVKMLEPGDLASNGAGFQFTYEWTQEQKEVGNHIIRAFAIRKHVKTDEDVFVELTGSPYRHIIQTQGVTFAVNSSGPAYQAVGSDITYDSEFQHFASFTYDNCDGARFTALGESKVYVDLPASMLKSMDGFLYSTFRSTGTEAIAEQRIRYKVDDIPNGNYTLRLHLICRAEEMLVNGVPIRQAVTEGLSRKQKSTDLGGLSGDYVDIPVKVTDNQLKIYTDCADHHKHSDKVSAFALLDNTYKDKVIPESKKQEYKEDKQKLADTTVPLVTTSTRKKLTIVGWSPNLLLNPTGEDGTSCWNIGGPVYVCSGGYGTESTFITSFVWGSKHQDVDLTLHFTPEYLDSAPDIQVLEWYKEGICGGGFYEFTAQLLSESGQVIKEYSTGELGTLYNDKKWMEASVVFTDYGPGVRSVSIESKAKDDKYWNGNYGPHMSAAQVRVKRETKPAEDDAFVDINILEGDQTKPLIDEMVSILLKNNHDLIKETFDEEDTPQAEDFEKEMKIKASMQRRETRKQKRRKKREVRVFVSSTFRDFSEEREEVIKKAFREINKMCAERGVFFTYVDLRWGITSEQTDGGKTISICLQEIERCRPYFLCMLGERFGWCQTEEKKDSTLNMSYDYAIENNPSLNWINKYRYDSSVTQLEVFHGVLNNPEKAKDRSFFYMRDPPDKEDLPEKEYQKRISESEWHAERQVWLKSQVKGHKDLKTRQFKLASEVAELIKKDLVDSIEEDFPKGTELTKLEQQREAHGAFAEARCRVYIGRDQYFTDINYYKNKGMDTPFVLLGESGSGKSALVANWSKRLDDSDPDAFKFVHFIGSSSDSASYMKILSRLYEEMKLFYNFDMEIPTSDAQLINELGKWLRMAGSICKVLLVFDALNQLDEGTGEDGPEHDLLWIPPKLPPNVFMLLSTLPGRAMTACENNEWPHMRVEPLDDSQKLQIITDYLTGIYGKTLSTEQKDLLIGAKQTSNALYLKSLLDEVRMYGSFRTLTDKIKDYLSAENPGDLFSKILERLESDFESGSNARDAIVHDTVTAIWCSHKGMSEGELVEYLQVPSAVWSPFYLSLYENLVNRNGVLNFSHDHLRQAVESKYLNTYEEKKAGYMRMIEFFSEQETSHRTVEELPFLLMRAGEIDRLEDYLKNLDVFYRLSGSDDGHFDLIKAWRAVGEFSLAEKDYLGELEKVSMKDIQKSPDYYSTLYSNLGKFLESVGLLEGAKTVYITLIKHLEVSYGESHGTIVFDHVTQSYKYRCKHPDVIKSLQELAGVYRGLGDLDMAIKVFKDAIKRQNRIETPTQSLQLCHGLLGLAVVYIMKENMPEAKSLMTKALELSTEVLGKGHHYVAAIFTQLGQLSYKQGRLDEALGYYLQDLKVTRGEVGHSHPRMATVLNEIALVYDDKNDEMAGKLYETALMIILETFGPNYLGTGTIRYNLGAFYLANNHFAKSKYQMEESYKLHVNFLGEDHPSTKSVKSALDTISKMV